jgi:hypothetical protein
MAINHRTKTMTIFCPQRFHRGGCVHQKAGASALQVHGPNCTTRLRGHNHEIGKTQCSNWQGAGQAYAAELKFYIAQALPLVKTRFLRLAKSSPMAARSPARWQRDGRAISGKIAGKMSRGIAAQLPGNGRATAAAMPPNVRRDDSQDNLPCTGLGRAMSALETCETTRNLAAQLPGNGRAMAAAMPPNVRQDGSQDSLPCAGRGRAVSRPETCETLATWSRNSRAAVRTMASDLSQAARRILAISL